MNTDHFGEYRSYYDFSMKKMKTDADDYTFILSEKMKEANNILGGDSEDEWEDDEIQEELGEWDSDEEEGKMSEAERLKQEFRATRLLGHMRDWKRKKIQFLPTGEIKLPNGTMYSSQT